MGLLRILKKTKEKEKEIRLLVLQVCLCRGLDNAGKTTMIKKLNGEDTSTISPTLGFNIKTFEFKNYRLNIWDVGGQTTIRSYWRNYFEQTDGLIWVVDSGDQLRLETCKQELHALLQQERLAGASLLVIANKQDVANALKKENIKDFLQLDKIIARHWAVVECSSITGKGLRTAFDWVVNDIASRIFLME